MTLPSDFQLTPWDASSSRTWRKETSASCRKQPSASERSFNACFDVYGMLLEEEAREIPSPAYTLHQLIGISSVNHVNSYKNIQKWLVDNLQDMTEEKIHIDKEIRSIKTLPTLGTTRRKRPDLVIYDTGDDEQAQVLVQIEVDSGDVETTCRKLSLGLVDQLRLQINHIDTINECRGFYFPPLWEQSRLCPRGHDKVERQFVDVQRGK